MEMSVAVPVQRSERDKKLGKRRSRSANEMDEWTRVFYADK